MTATGHIGTEGMMFCLKLLCIQDNAKLTHNIMSCMQAPLRKRQCKAHAGHHV